MIPEVLQQPFAFRAIQAYAAHSYLYYERNTAILFDEEFDYLCVWILENWDWIKPHDINKYLDKSALQAGTGFHLKVVGLTRDYAERLLQEHIDKNKRIRIITPKKPVEDDGMDLV